MLRWLSIDRLWMGYAIHEFGQFMNDIRCSLTYNYANSKIITVP